MKKNLVLFSVIFVALFISMISATDFSNPVTFNGDFKSGTTLYSDTYHLDGYIYSKDVYPIKSSITTTLVCQNKTVTSKQYICANTTIGYKYVNSVRVPIYGNRCSWQTVSIVQTVCSKVTTPISCYNPKTGAYTNQLALVNFQYSLNGLTWKTVPYCNMFVNDSDITFRVNIPNVCSPSYDINNAIFIQ